MMEIKFDDETRKFFDILIHNLEKNKSLSEQEANGLRYRLGKL